MSLTFFLTAPARAWCPSVQVLAWRGRSGRPGLFQLPVGRILAALRAAGPIQLAAWAHPACGARTGKVAAPPSHFEGTGVWWAEWPASDKDRERQSHSTLWVCCPSNQNIWKKHLCGKMQTAWDARGWKWGRHNGLREQQDTPSWNKCNKSIKTHLCLQSVSTSKPHQSKICCCTFPCISKNVRDWVVFWSATTGSSAAAVFWTWITVDDVPFKTIDTTFQWHMMHRGKWLTLKNLSVILIAEQMQITQTQLFRFIANWIYLMVLAFITICSNSVLNR